MNNMAGDDLWEYGHLIAPGHSEFSIEHELFKFKSTSRAAYNSAGIYLTSFPYIEGKDEQVQLYGFPFLAIDVNPSDIEYPAPLSGLIITQDMRMLDYFVEQDPDFHHEANPETSRLAWAKGQNLPTILAVHHANGHTGNMEGLSKLAGMDIFCPVVWHNGEPGASFFRKAIKALTGLY